MCALTKTRASKKYTEHNSIEMEHWFEIDQY